MSGKENKITITAGGPEACASSNLTSIWRAANPTDVEICAQVKVETQLVRQLVKEAT